MRRPRAPFGPTPETFRTTPPECLRTAHLLNGKSKLAVVRLALHLVVLVVVVLHNHLLFRHAGTQGDGLKMPVLQSKPLSQLTPSPQKTHNTSCERKIYLLVVFQIQLVLDVRSRILVGLNQRGETEAAEAHWANTKGSCPICLGMDVVAIHTSEGATPMHAGKCLGL